MSLRTKRVFKSMKNSVMPPNVLLNLDKVSDSMHPLRKYSGYIVSKKSQMSLLLQNKIKFPIIKHLCLTDNLKRTDQLEELLKQIEYLTLDQTDSPTRGKPFPDLKTDVFYPLKVLTITDYGDTSDRYRLLMRHTSLGQAQQFLQRYIFVENCIFTVLHTLEISYSGDSYESLDRIT